MRAFGQFIWTQVFMNAAEHLEANIRIRRLVAFSFVFIISPIEVTLHLNSIEPKSYQHFNIFCFIHNKSHPASLQVNSKLQVGTFCWIFTLINTLNHPLITSYSSDLLARSSRDQNIMPISFDHFLFFRSISEMLSRPEHHANYDKYGLNTMIYK
jgi:hypothetical protein